MFCPVEVPGIEAKNISVSLDNRLLLDDVSISVLPGEVMALIGPNGAGKSTLISVLSGNRKPDSGEVLLNGETLSKYGTLECARRLSVLEQNPVVSFGYLASEVVRMGRMPWRRTVHAKDDDAVVEYAMLNTDSRELADIAVTYLSGGERGRVSMARVLAQQTQVVILDEPAAAMDIKHRERTYALGRQLADAGASVINVVHDLDAVASWADRVCLLVDGKVFADGYPTHVLTADILSKAYDTHIDVFRHPETKELIIRPKR